MSAANWNWDVEPNWFGKREPIAVAMLSPVLSAMREAKRDSEILLALDAGDGDACGEVSESGYICTRRAEPHDLHVAHGTDENEHTYVCETWIAI